MMKSIVDISWQVSEEEYRADKAISYSTLSRFDREGFRKLDSLFEKISSPSLLFGSAVDTMVTDGLKAFNDRFIVCEFPSLSDNLIIIAKGLFKHYGDKYRTVDLIPDEEILSYTLGYQPTWGNEARLRNIRSKCGEYYKLLNLAGDKEILSQRDYNDVIACSNELKTNPYTKAFFNINPFDTRFEKVFQLKFKAKYEGIDVRCMMDLAVIDHLNKKIYPVDLKTSGHAEEEFDKSFLTWRYMIQAQLYTYILSECIKQDEYFKDFKIQCYNFIVINRVTKAPLVWKYYGNFAEIDFVGPDGTLYRNWRKLLVELNYYLTNNDHKYTREARENKGIMIINNLKPV